MLKSMTGYGACEREIDDYVIAVEIKSVNHRYAEITIKAPKCLSCCENRIKSVVAGVVRRGKADVCVTLSCKEREKNIVEVDFSMADRLVKAANEIKERYSLSGELTINDIISFGGVFNIKSDEIDSSALETAVLEMLAAALRDFEASRQREGEQIYDDIIQKTDKLEEYLHLIERREPKIIADYTERLKKTIKELLGGSAPDEQRIITEAAVFADKICTDEETVRLKCHIESLRKLLNSQSPIGKKPDFIIQEINREINTVGSKCCDFETADIVINFKSEVEKIREQIQNIE